MTGLSGRRLLAPAAYSEAIMPSLQLARSSRAARVIAKVVLFFLVVAILLAAFAPWQQSVKGSGSVVAFLPDERQQPVEAPIKGRIVRWGDGIFENAHVEQGQLIVEIQDIDPDLLGRLEEQKTALEETLAAAREQLAADQRRIIAVNENLAPLQAQLASYEGIKDQVELGANAAVDAAKNKVEAERQALVGAQAVEFEARADFERQSELYDLEIASQAKFQAAQRKSKEASAKVLTAREYVEQASNDLIAKERDRDAKIRKAQISIDYTKGLLTKQSVELEKAKGDAAKASGAVNKALKELSEMENKLARQQSQRVEAPIDGFLTQITPNMGTQILKEGDSLCVIVPDSKDRSVQIWLDGNDAPLVEPGRHVRLQFEGWPAVQFAGWPSVAVGTFGGEVISVDATDNGKGKFRVFVRPDPTDEPWPDQRYLRQGVRTNGWVLLKQVPLWFEIWRTMNGFPPVISDDAPEKTDKGDKKKVKPPKM